MFANVFTRGESVFEKLIRGSCPKSALVVTGGMFRGVRSVGMLCSLGALRFNTAFDGAYGVSAGIGNIMYFLCDQAPLGASIYYQDLLDSKFLSFLRWPPVDISYLAYEVAGRKKRLLEDRLFACRTVLRAVVTERLSGRGRFLTVGTEIFPLDALNIGQSFIIWGNGSICHAGGWYSDGFISEPIPFRQVLADGYRNILILLNMPLSWHPPRTAFSRVY